MAQPKEAGRDGSLPDNIKNTQRQWSRDLGGPHWPEIQQWHAQGLGRAIGTDIYAIRHTTGSENWWDDRVLLLFPNKKTTDLCLVGPQISQSSESEEAFMENEGYWSEFIAQFSPSEHPYRPPSWQPGEDAFDSFLRNASTFSVFVHKRSFSSEERGNVIDAALTNARALQERDRVQTMVVTSNELIDALDPKDFGFLAKLDERFAVHLERRARERVLAQPTVAVDDIVTLYEDLHRLERDEEV